MACPCPGGCCWWGPQGTGKSLTAQGRLPTLAMPLPAAGCGGRLFAGLVGERAKRRQHREHDPPARSDGTLRALDRMRLTRGFGATAAAMGGASQSGCWPACSPDGREDHGGVRGGHGQRVANLPRADAQGALPTRIFLLGSARCGRAAHASWICQLRPRVRPSIPLEVGLVDRHDGFSAPNFEQIVVEANAPRAPDRDFSERT